jgi:hypothetical protein
VIEGKTSNRDEKRPEHQNPPQPHKEFRQAIVSPLNGIAFKGECLILARVLVQLGVDRPQESDHLLSGHPQT